MTSGTQGQYARFCPVIEGVGDPRQRGCIVVAFVVAITTHWLAVGIEVATRSCSGCRPLSH